jgi:hypothetical protein
MKFRGSDLLVRGLSPVIFHHEAVSRVDMRSTLLIFAGVFIATVAVRSIEASPSSLMGEGDVKVLSNEAAFINEPDAPLALGCRRQAKILSAADPKCRETQAH